MELVVYTVLYQPLSHFNIYYISYSMYGHGDLVPYCIRYYGMRGFDIV
jgi:hypothetical protein